jgi:hypothetical protein
MKNSLGGPEPPVFYDACFLLNNADPLFKSLLRWRIDVSH